MTVRLAIIADDLTGALDTSVAFAGLGLRVRVAISVAGIAAALADEPELIAVNTASRNLTATQAAQIVHQAVEALMPAAPQCFFKKVDSRLKGNVGAETQMLATMTGARLVRVAPAVPRQKRVTRDGCVVGAGVPTPIEVMPLFAEVRVPVQVADAASDADLDAIAGAEDRVLMVGASGLGGALARRMGQPLALPGIAARLETLFAFGSRDPITLAQIKALQAKRADITAVDMPQGIAAAALPTSLPAVLSCGGEMTEPPKQVAERFAVGVIEAVRRLDPAVLVVGGGDTALAVLEELGALVLTPEGEALPGIVAVRLMTRAGKPLTCLVKSGGFGNVDALVELLPPAPPSALAANEAAG